MRFRFLFMLVFSMPYRSRSFRRFSFPILSTFLSNEILKMKLLLFALLSISNGYYESNGLHDVGTVDSGLDAGITVERRSLLLYLKPWTLELVNSRARDDRTSSKIIPWSMDHQRTNGPQATVRSFLSKAFAKLKKTTCIYNLHYLLMNPNIHYLLKLPIAQTLFSSRIPAFLEFMNNLKLGPSATSGKIY